MERMAVFSGSGDGNFKRSQFYDHGNRKDVFSPVDESITSPSSSSSSSVPGFIEHRVSKFDTLAGVAIKYGVEVADIKKMNGLITDLQMFALKSIQIPLPGRHPPSPCLSIDEIPPREWSVEVPSIRRFQLDFLDSFEPIKPCSFQKKTPCLQVKSMGSRCLLEDFEREFNGEQPLIHHRKSKSFINSMLDESSGGSENENLLRRRQKSEADFTLFAGEENNTRSKGKGLAQRSSAASRNGDMGHVSTSPGECGVRKSSSTSSLQEQETVSLRGALKRNLKPDLHPITAATIGKPIFDGLPKPLVARRNKAALD